MLAFLISSPLCFRFRDSRDVNECSAESVCVTVHTYDERSIEKDLWSGREYRYRILYLFLQSNLIFLKYFMISALGLNRKVRAYCKRNTILGLKYFFKAFGIYWSEQCRLDQNTFN